MQLDDAPRLAARPCPAWLLVLSGALATCTVLERHEAARVLDDEAARAGAALLPGIGGQEARVPELASGSARELRRLPGIGRRRAEAFVRVRWERRESGFALTDVPGIGPATAQLIEAWLADERNAAGVQSSGEE